MGRWTIVNTLLGVMVALLGFEIVRTWAHKLPPVEVPPSAAPPAPVDPPPHEKGKRGAAEKGGKNVQQTPAMLVAAIADKDLFDPSRRAPSPEEVKVDVVPVTKPPDGVTIVGVRIFGKDREVFVNDATQSPPAGRRLRLGDQVAGFTVKMIEPTLVTLISPSGDPVSMPLVIDKGKGQPGQPATIQRPTSARPRPGRGQPASSSPAAGPQGASPAAGVGGTPPPPVPAVPRPGVAAQQPPQPGQPEATQPLPAQVRQKLEQLRQNDKRPGRRR